MRKVWFVLLALALGASIAGCSKKSIINSYVLPDVAIGGDTAKGIAPIDRIVVWPMINMAAGSKAKGIEQTMTDYLVDSLHLNNSFKSIYIVREGGDKDLLARAGEELGMKKKPKTPTDAALITTKIGQLTGTDAILVGRIDTYDEVKVDKTTYSAVGLSFFLYDARELSYETLDSFTPTKDLWRTNAHRRAKETAFQARGTLYDTGHDLLAEVIERIEDDLRMGGAAQSKAVKKKVRQMKKEAKKLSKKGMFDESIVLWNDILELDPADKDAAKQIAAVTEKKTAAEEKEKEKQKQEQIAMLEKAAEKLKEAGDLEGAKGQWQKILELEEDNSNALSKIQSIDEDIAAAAAVAAEEDAAAAEREKSKNLHLAQQALGDMKYTEAIAAARKVLAVDSGNAKAKDIIEVAEQKLEESRAAEEEVTSAPAREEPPPPPAEKPAVEPAVEPPPPPAEKPKAAAGSSEVDDLRNQAMEYFNSEKYSDAESTWQKILEIVPGDKQAQEMLETTQMLIEALR